MNKKERTARFNALIKTLRESETFGAPACIQRHCLVHFNEGLHKYLGLSLAQEFWIINGHFSHRDYKFVTKKGVITALEKVRDRKVPDNPYEPNLFKTD